MTRPVQYTGCAECVCPKVGQTLTEADVVAMGNTVTAMCPVEESGRELCRGRKPWDKPLQVLVECMRAGTLAPPCYRARMARANDRQRFEAAGAFRKAFQIAYDTSS